MVPSSSRPLVAVCVALGASACGGMGGNLASGLARPPEYRPPGQTKCAVKRSVDHPLVVEWPAADRASLETKARRGVVAVHYAGCEMEVLDRCEVSGRYAYTGLTPMRDRLSLTNADDLYAKLPLGAAKLEGRVDRGGRIDVDTTIVGRYDADRSDFTTADLRGQDCARATHVVSGMTIGAFKLLATGRAKVDASAHAVVAGADASSEASTETLEQDGRPNQCFTADPKVDAPPGECGVVIRVDVLPVEPAASPPLPEPPPSSQPSSGNASPPDLPPFVWKILGAPRRTANVQLKATCAGDPQPQLLVDGAAAAPSPGEDFSATLGVAWYELSPGHHALRVSAPGCNALESSVDVPQTGTVRVTAELPPSAPLSGGTTGSPAGFGGWIGVGGAGVPGYLRSFTSQGASVALSGTTWGFVVGGGYQSRFWILEAALPFYFLQGVSGTVVTANGTQLHPDVTVSAYSPLDALIGARLPLGFVSIAAGTGIALDIYSMASMNGSFQDQGGAYFTTPLWARVDLKPFCGWGVRAYGTYELVPYDASKSWPTFAVGIFGEGSDVCHPGVHVTY